jgi:hypothetical protein
LGFQPCKFVSISVHSWFPSPLRFDATRKLFCPVRAM